MLENFRADFKVGNSEFSEPEHIAAALRELADAVEGGRTAGTILDVNGNAVVKFKMELAEAEED